MEKTDFFNALDNHNIASGNESWFGARINTVTDLVTDVAQGISYGIPTSIIAGINSIANSAIATANFLGSDIEPINTYNMMKELDNDLGRYYIKHQEGVETAGFLITSLAPGMAGVKAMQAAKAGFIGKNTAQSTGLMASLTADYAKAARVEFASGTSPFKILNENVVKSLAQGFGSAALDMAAFEIAVTATMYKSPVLDEQSFSDLTKNVLLGAVIGGGIGGAIHGVGLISGIKKAGNIADKELFPFRHIEELGDNASSDLKIINYYKQKFELPQPALMEGITSEVAPDVRLKLITSEREKTLGRLDELISEELISFSGKDKIISKQLFEILSKAKTADDVTYAMLHTKSASRIGQAEALEFGDVLFPIHGIPQDKFQFIKAGGDWDMLFSPKASDATKGFIIKGNLAELKVTGAKEIEANGITYGSKEAAFNAGFDLYRNANGNFSVNPLSKIIQSAAVRRTENNIILDTQQNGAIVNKATAGLADFATVDKPIKVIGSQVIAGDLKPIQIGNSIRFNPVTDDSLSVQARYVWAQEQKNIKWEGRIVGENDLPLLEKAYYDGEKAKGFLIKFEDNKVVVGPQGEVLGRLIESKKAAFAKAMDGLPIDEIGNRLNVTDKWLKGEADDLARIRPGVDYNNPRYIKINFADDINARDALNANNLEGAIQFEREVALIKERAKQTTANYDAMFTDVFPEAPNWADAGRTPTRQGTGASIAGFSNSLYGTAGSWAQFTGTLTNKLKLNKVTAMAEELNPALSSVAAIGAEAKAELSLIFTKLRSLPDAYVFHPVKPNILVPKSEYKAILDKKIADSAEQIVIKNAAVADVLKTHQTIAGRRQTHIANLKGSAGVGDNFDSLVIYPPPIDTIKYKHFVFVEPRGINLADKKRIIAAKDETTLEKLVSQVDQTQFKVTTKMDKENFHKAVGDYDFSLGLNESVVDSTLKRKGILSDFLPTTSSDRVLDDLMAWHVKQEELLATRMVEHRYSQSFTELRRLSERYTNLATSQFRSLTAKLEQSVKDPYNDVIKTALDISRASEYRWWTSFNDTVKNAIEGPVNKLREVFTKADKIDDAFVATVNKISDDLGLGRPFETAYSVMVANGNVAPQPWLAKGIAKAQSVLSTTLLQWDFFNAINNTVATPILLNAEVNSLFKAIRTARPDLVGKLSELTQVSVPESSGLTLPTTSKLIRNALQNYRTDATSGGAILKRYEDIRAVTNILQQERQMLDNLTFNFTETAGQIETKIAKATEFGKKWTGNKLAEEMQRFVAADVMRQITDIALEAGVLKNIGQANEYILNFVNKTQGNYLASQRPIIFQGVVGQAISLFQTYQFNLMQQLFRHIGEGDKKSVAMLLGLQGGIYGMQGLPAFNFLNTHIVGNAAGNTEHKDLYYAANSVFGKQLGDWILYGAGSNALGLIDPQLKINLYSRGDINPRQVTVLPTTLSDIPVISASVRFVTNIWQAGEKLAAGGSFWPTISQAIEHNGLSRPLAGLAQVAQGYTTTSQSSLLTASQDFYNIAQVARIGGGKPFDEAVALDALYRINAYRAKDLAKIKELGSAIKTTVVGNKEPTEQQITDFAAAYAKSGGRIESFNKFFAGVYSSANQSQVNKIAMGLKSPFAQQMQVIMGGQPLPDYFNTGPTSQ